MFEGDRRFDIVVRLPNTGRDDLDAVGVLPVIFTGRRFCAAERGRHGFRRSISAATMADGASSSGQCTRQ